MEFTLQYVGDHLFINGVFGIVVQNGYFYCNHPNCPYALRVTVQYVEGQRRAVVVESVVCSVHYHEDDDKPRGHVRKEIASDLLLIGKEESSD